MFRNCLFASLARKLYGCTLLVLLSVSVFAQQQTLLLRQPALSEKLISFVYGGDIWLANLDGSQPRRLTSHPAVESNPKFSPDGKWLAYSARYENNIDVYVVSVSGGQATRLTWHPGADTVNDWSRNGKTILFSSAREMRNGRSNQLFQVSKKGGFPEKIMDAVAVEGSWSTNGKRIAYRPYWRAHAGSSGWRLHRGGATPPIWIINPDNQKVEKIPHENASDSNPMWLSGNVYFISDRDNQAANLFSYNTSSKRITQLTREDVWDVKSADTGNDRIIYEVGGRLKIFDLDTQRSKDVKVFINPDSPQTRPAWKNASSTIQSIGLSPTGKRALLTARGEVFTVPVKKGSTRNITTSGDVRESNAIWSPKGDRIAYISDKGSVHRLVVVDQTGLGEVQTFDLGPAYYSLLKWGTNAERIVYQDNHLNLYVINLAENQSKLIRTNVRRSGAEVSLSPDGKWLVYTQSGANYFGRLVLYEFATERSVPLTDGLSWASSPAFSRDGQYLYFMASTNAGPLQVGLDMTTREKPLRNAIYTVVLANDGKSSGDEGDEDAESDEADENSTEADSDDESGNGKDQDEPVNVVIDLEGIERRIVSLPIAERFYTDLSVADDGSLYYLERRQPGASNELPASERRAVNKLNRFDIKEKEVTLVKENIANYIMSHDGKNLLILGSDGGLFIAEIAEKIKPESLDVSDVKAYIDPRQEWRQIFDEVWRMEKEFFYAENLHGLDWEAIRKRYQPLLPHVTTREDLNLLLVEMIAEFQVGHNRIRGGDIHRESSVAIGLLGADLRIEKDHYRVKKIYTGERWNPFLKAPLAPPGIGIKQGDYILAVNGHPIDHDVNIFSMLAQTVDKQVTLSVNDQPKMAGSREVVVEPIRNEFLLRQWNWIEENRQTVEDKTDGRVGYVYLPDTAAGGFTYFNRMFFAQIDKQALIIDERKNNGGQAANYVIDVLNRGYLGSWKDRNAMIFETPGGAIYGPKVMLINQDAGSGGDFLPYAFRHLGLGKLIGTRTWGGLIGISANPGLIDGGSLVVPFFRFFSTDGTWRIENEGVAPDIEVELEPDAVNKGIDMQLDRAIEEVLQQLENYTPVKQPQAPSIPTRPGQ